MNGAFQMKYYMGPNSAIFSLKNFFLAEVGFEPESPGWEAIMHYSNKLTLREW